MSIHLEARQVLLIQSQMFLSIKSNIVHYIYEEIGSIQPQLSVQLWSVYDRVEQDPKPRKDNICNS